MNALVSLLVGIMMSAANATASRGFLIAVEGCDRCGKSTQCFRAKEWLESTTGRPVEYWKFPDRTTPIGKMINGYLESGLDLDDEAIHLLFAANRREVKDKMKEKLASGTSIILDRYVYSGVSYSVAKGMDYNWCKAADHGLPQPDLVLFIDLPAEVAQARSDYGAERYEKVEFQAKVRATFGHLIEEESQNNDIWRIVDGNRTPDEIQANINEILTTKLLDKPVAPLQSIQWL